MREVKLILFDDQTSKKFIELRFEPDIYMNSYSEKGLRVIVNVIKRLIDDKKLY